MRVKSYVLLVGCVWLMSQAVADCGSELGGFLDCVDDLKSNDSVGECLDDYSLSELQDCVVLWGDNSSYLSMLLADTHEALSECETREAGLEEDVTSLKGDKGELTNSLQHCQNNVRELGDVLGGKIDGMEGSREEYLECVNESVRLKARMGELEGSVNSCRLERDGCEKELEEKDKIISYGCPAGMRALVWDYKDELAWLSDDSFSCFRRITQREDVAFSTAAELWEYGCQEEVRASRDSVDPHEFNQLVQAGLLVPAEDAFGEVLEVDKVDFVLTYHVPLHFPISCLDEVRETVLREREMEDNGFVSGVFLMGGLGVLFLLVLLGYRFLLYDLSPPTFRWRWWGFLSEDG